MVSNNKQYPLTYEGLKKKEQRLEYLKSEKRAEVAERIKQSREFGDISENAEYDDAKNEQGKVENEIIELEEILKHVKLIDEDEVSLDHVALGTTVKILDIDENEELTYTIVGSLEANPDENKISNVSPLGKALLEKRAGDIVEVSAQAGTIKFKVIEILKKS